LYLRPSDSPFIIVIKKLINITVSVWNL